MFVCTLHVFYSYIPLCIILQWMTCPYSSYYCEFHGRNCALSMKLYLKSIQMMTPRNEVWKSRSGTSERCKNKIHWDVNVSLIERESEREEMGQDKWSELIKWDEMSKPLRHLGVYFISPSPLYRVVSTNQPQVTTASAVMMGSMLNNKKKKNQFVIVIMKPGQKQHAQDFTQKKKKTFNVVLDLNLHAQTLTHVNLERPENTGAV